MTPPRPQLSMTPERWRRLEELFEAAIELEPQKRPEFLAEECGEDHALQRQLLLMLDDQGTVGLADVVIQAANDIPDDPWAGRRMGAYRIIRTIGRGGMGAVFLATRDDEEFRKDVAIKTLHFNAGDAGTLARFRQERQMLAALEHPNIAHLLDGGTTDDGVPYIVLEFIEGLPITGYCSANHLSLEARLRLFQSVCRAVHYAHQKLIVHRDVKPGNILVNREGVPKLLDFGIGKLLDRPNEMMTLTGATLMTPDYASPEQVRGEPISTATDVYSLGAVLYEMLTGHRPHALKNYDPAEIVQVICQTEVSPPSTTGNPRLRGDLDKIVLKAMQKSPARRYESAAQFADDIERHLTRLPVVARPDTFRYRAEKFARRNRFQLVAAAMIAIALVGGIIASQREARRAERRFQDVRQLANSFIFDVNARLQAAGPTAVSEQIVTTALKYLETLAAEARNDASLMTDLAAAYQTVGDIQSQSLGRIDDARRSYARTLELSDRLQSSGAVQKAMAGAYLGMLEIDSRHGNMQAAMKSGERAIVIAGQVPDSQWSRDFLIRAYGLVARPYIEVGQPNRALAAYRSGLRLLENGIETPPQIRASLHRRLAQALKNHGDLESAVAEENRARSLYSTIEDPADSRYASEIIYALLGPALGEGAGPHDLVIRLSTPLYRKQAREFALQAMDKDPKNTVLRRLVTVTHIERGVDLLAENRKAAYQSFRYATQVADELLRTDPGSATIRGNLATSEFYLGDALASSGNSNEGIPHLRRAVELADTIPAATPMERRLLIEALLRLGNAEMNARQFQLARTTLDRCIQLSEALWPDARDDLRSFAYIGMSYEAMGRLERLHGNSTAACEAYRKSMETWEAWPTVGVSNFYTREHLNKVKTAMAVCQNN